jgi:tetratricopeptide (TPR) repeat protein
MSDLPFDPPLDQPLRGETIVFTGKLWSRGRKDARAVVEKLGGSSDEDVTLRTTLLVVGAGSYPDGAPDPALLLDDSSTQNQKLRRVAQINAEHPGRIRVLSEDEFLRQAGLPTVDELRTQHYGQKDILTMYPDLREDHLRYLQKWGFIKPAFRNNADTWFSFTDLVALRQVHGELQEGASFRAVLRELQSTRTGQLAFDFRVNAPPARIIELKPKATPPGLRETPAPAPSEVLSPAEQYFLMGSLLDDGTPDRIEEAIKAYRRALEHDPDLVAALINLANIRYSRDELAEAQALYERAIALDPSYFEAHFNLGNIHHDHARYAEAEASYRSALALNTSYPDAHFYLAVTLEKMGRSVDARTHWKAYERLAPQGEWVELAKEFSD